MSDPRAVIPAGMEAACSELGLSPGVLSNGHLFVTGMTGAATVGADDPEGQFHAAFALIERVLAAAGLDFSSVVEMTSYHIDIERHFDTFAEVRKSYLSAPYPAWTAVEVAGLRRAGALVEVRVVAHVPA